VRRFLLSSPVHATENYCTRLYPHLSYVPPLPHLSVLLCLLQSPICLSRFRGFVLSPLLHRSLPMHTHTSASSKESQLLSMSRSQYRGFTGLSGKLIHTSNILKGPFLSFQMALTNQLTPFLSNHSPAPGSSEITKISLAKMCSCCGEHQVPQVYGPSCSQLAGIAHAAVCIVISMPHK